MEVNAHRPRDRVNSQRRDLPLSVRIHLDAGRARVAKGAQAAQARRDGVHGPQHIASILRKGLEPAWLTHRSVCPSEGGGVLGHGIPPRERGMCTDK